MCIKTNVKKETLSKLDYVNFTHGNFLTLKVTYWKHEGKLWSQIYFIIVTFCSQQTSYIALL